MDIMTRKLSANDKTQALWVEAGAMPHNRYLADVWDIFTHKTDGDLLGAFVDNSLVGIGKITRLYQHYGWLETLRVHPEWQRKGVGAALWKQFFIEMEKMQLRAAGMYTEYNNTASKTLAKNFGLTVEVSYTEFLRPVSDVSSIAHDFVPVSTPNGEAAMAPHYANMPPHLVVNRTFFPVAEGLGAYFASMGWLYKNSTDEILIAGNRFHPERLLHVPYFSGIIEKSLAFAEQLARKQSAPRLSCLVPPDSTHAEKMKKSAFRHADEFLTLWIDL